MPRDPKAGEWPAFLGFGHERIIDDDTPDDSHAPVGAIHGKQTHPCVLKWKPIEDEWIVAGHEQLAITI
jgi:hypothetical protein